MIFRVIPPGDLEIRNKRFVVARGRDYRRQKIAVRFKFFLGEWFRNQLEGVPMYRDVFVKNPNLTLIRQIFYEVLTEHIPGIVAVPRFELAFDARARELAFDFEAYDDNDQPLVVKPDDPLFILKV
jgi:hypothetical protein